MVNLLRRYKGDLGEEAGFNRNELSHVVSGQQARRGSENRCPDLTEPPRAPQTASLFRDFRDTLPGKVKT